MPYKGLSELSDSVENHLPHHAQEIDVNHAWDEYEYSSIRSVRY